MEEKASSADLSRPPRALCRNRRKRENLWKIRQLIIALQ